MKLFLFFFSFIYIQEEEEEEHNDKIDYMHCSDVSQTRNKQQQKKSFTRLQSGR
jgi:hypothetical protein